MKPQGRWFYILNETKIDGIACGVSRMFRRNKVTNEDTLTLDAVRPVTVKNRRRTLRCHAKIDQRGQHSWIPVLTGMTVHKRAYK